MALRVGIDLVSVESVREAMVAHGDRYLARVYTPGELEDCMGRAGVDPERLAARFAAKEAVFKVLQVGDQAVAWLDVETRTHHPSGSVKLILSGSAADIAARAGITDLSLSFTHERGCAAAVVIAEIPKTADSEPMTSTPRRT
jgi:holo-[acyl-carrier protein] synthase